MSKKKYTYIRLFEKGILEMKETRKAKREMAKTLGLEKEQINRGSTCTSCRRPYGS